MSTEYEKNNTEGDTYSAIGRRFRLERERLGFTQKTLAVRLCTTARTIITYESGDLPKLNILIRFMGAGADISYILTGVKISSVGEERRTYTPASEIAEVIEGLKLSRSDADMLLALAKRLESDTHKSQQQQQQGREQ